MIKIIFLSPCILIQSWMNEWFQDPPKVRCFVPPPFEYITWIPICKKDEAFVMILLEEECQGWNENMVHVACFSFYLNAFTWFPHEWDSNHFHDSLTSRQRKGKKGKTRWTTNRNQQHFACILSFFIVHWTQLGFSPRINANIFKEKAKSWWLNTS